MPAYNPNGYDPADYQVTTFEQPVNPVTGANLPTAQPAQPNAPAGGGGSPFDFLTNLLGGGGNTPLGLSSFLPAILSGAHGLYNSGQYMDNAREAARMASPVSQETREGYQRRLEQLYTDPTAFLEGNPEFNATRKLGMGAINAKNAARGNIMDGTASADELTFLSDLGSRFLSQERKDLMHMGGFQFDPANAASMLMKGGQQEIDARSNALAALLYPFGAGQGPGRGPTGSQHPAQNGGVPRPGASHPGASGGTSNMLQRISQLPLSSLTPQLFQALGMIQGGVNGLFNPDPDTLSSLAQMGITPDGAGGFSVNDIGTGGAVDNPFGTLEDPYGLGGGGGGGGFGPMDPFGPGSSFDWSGLSNDQWESLFGNGGDFTNWFETDMGLSDLEWIANL